MHTPYKTLAFFFFLTISISVFAQVRNTPQVPGGPVRWISFEPAAAVTTKNVWAQYGKQIGIPPTDEMQLVKSETDRFGWTHHRYQQIHQGVPVEFAMYRLHERDGFVLKGNGAIAEKTHVTTFAALSSDEALQKALQYVNAEIYAWEVPALEDMKKFATDNPDATFYPEGQLLIADADFKAETPSSYRLAWKFEIHAAQPESRRWIYIDAQTGEVFKEMNLDIHGHPGTAETRYSGVQNITTDSTANGYVLRDNTRGRGVITLDALDSTSVRDAVDFVDDDNYWERNDTTSDDAATDAHWAAGLYYDYLLHRHGINSYDNLGSKMICYVHFDKNWYNASWTGYWTRYGDAGGDPWTHIDVVGHEFTHGFTWAFSGLVYEGEPGALNESISDILGEALQRYGHGGVIDWVATPAPVDSIRSYSDPKSFEHPNTYLGEFWATGPGDNFGVHTNSGVQNYWFYLLSEGGAGVNDNGDAYDIAGIGFEKAIDITVRNHTVYLHPSSGYFDAREGSLQAAEDLFGHCSFEYQQVANAWYAVGVGDPYEAEDFAGVSVEKAGDPEVGICVSDPMAPVKMTFKYLGCDTSAPAELLLKLVKTNPLSIYTDTFRIETGAHPGQVFEHVFSKEFDFSRKGEHQLTAEVISPVDLYTGNNATPTEVEYNIASTSDQAFRFHNRVALRTFRDSMAITKGDFSDVDILSNVGNDSTYGIRIQGDELWYTRPVYEGQDIFDANKRLGAKVCFCVDATAYDTVRMSFDLLQTFAKMHERVVGIPQPVSSCVRVLVSEEEMARYFPGTTHQDEWINRKLDLSDYARQQFEVCFETRTLIGADEDFENGVGDRVFLDNIIFSGSETVSASSTLRNVTPLTIYPNPATAEAWVDVHADTYGKAELFITDVPGKVLLHQYVQLLPGLNQIRIPISGIPSGAYLLEVLKDDVKMIGKIVVE